MSKGILNYCKSSWVIKSSYVGGPPIQYPIYCDSVVTTTILWVMWVFGSTRSFQYIQSIKKQARQSSIFDQSQQSQCIVIGRKFEKKLILQCFQKLTWLNRQVLDEVQLVTHWNSQLHSTLYYSMLHTLRTEFRRTSPCGMYSTTGRSMG